jgi:hypothetical protein
VFGFPRGFDDKSFLMSMGDSVMISRDGPLAGESIIGTVVMSLNSEDDKGDNGYGRSNKDSRIAIVRVPRVGRWGGEQSGEAEPHQLLDSINY